MADQPQQGAVMTYEAQSARDAQARGYGGEGYADYLEQHARDTRDYYLRHGELEKAAEQMTRSLGDALAGNDGE
jgi:hypothetical protein